MTTQVFNQRINTAKKLLTALKNDIKYRQELDKQGKPIYEADSQIRGTFQQLKDINKQIQAIYTNFRSNPKDFGISNKQLQKRSALTSQINSDIYTLQKQYDQLLTISIKSQPPKEQNSNNANEEKYQKMTKQQLLQNKQKQQNNQEEALDELIVVVKNIKKGNQHISEAIDEQDVGLDELGKGMDNNMQQMGKVKKNMMKLLDSSSNLCLIFAIIIEIAGLICILLLWN